MMKEKNLWKQLLPVVGICLGSAALLMGLTTAFGWGNSPPKSAVSVMAGAENAEPSLSLRDTTDMPPVPQRETDPETAETVDLNEISDAMVRLSFSPLMQNPELPNGCEVVSLLSVLRFLGFSENKVSFTNLYLPMGKIGEVSPYTSFVGSPFAGERGYGCFSPVIVQTANRYFERKDAAFRACSLDGSSLETLQAQIDSGLPVIVWCSVGMTTNDDIVAEWNVDGTHSFWYRYSHCMVLIGYTKDTYLFADPLSGVVAYSKERAERVFSMLGCQAVGFRRGEE